MLNEFKLANYHWLKYLIYHIQDLKIYMLQVYIYFVHFYISLMKYAEYWSVFLFPVFMVEGT